MKACHRWAILIGFSVLSPHCPLFGQEQAASSAANGHLRVRFSSSVALGRIEAEPLPEYPQQAIDKQIEGTVILHVVVGDDGTVKQEEATSGPPELTTSALDAVRKWRFGKTFLNQQPVEIDTTFALVYALHPTPAVSVDKDYKPTPASDTSNAPSVPSKGAIEGTTYKNSSIGVQFTLAPGLRFEQVKDLPDTDGVSVVAQSDPSPAYGLTLFMTDELAHYPEDQRNAPTYLQKLVRVNEADGFQVTGGNPSAEISGVQFVRADFVRGLVHETILVTTHDGHALVFLFSGASVDRTDNLIGSTDLKLTP